MLNEATRLGALSMMQDLLLLPLAPVKAHVRDTTNTACLGMSAFFSLVLGAPRPYRAFDFDSTLGFPGEGPLFFTAFFFLGPWHA